MDALSVTYGDSSPGGRALAGAPRRSPTRWMTLQRQNGGSKPPPYDGDWDAREVAKRRAEALPKEKAKKRDAEGVIPYKET